ncbi:MAG: hypothetical protein JSU66_09090, partial [Deltaproteobacteria bacterium]
MSDASLRDLERRLGLPGLAERLRAVCDEAPRPDASEILAADLLAAAHGTDAAGLAAAFRRDPEGLIRCLAPLCGVAPFLARRFSYDPAGFFALLEDDLVTPRSLAEYEARLDRALAAAPEGGEGAALRQFKYLELARITVRDCSESLVPGSRVEETLAELSHLADAILSRALRLAAARLASRLGPPCWTDAGGGSVELAFCVLGLGKLGSEELNYSSDVDLVYVFESAAAPGALRGGPGERSPEEYFTRLARDFGREVGEVTADGFLYRIDLDLRPEGGHGALAVSSEALESYYDGRAATWEKAAFMKARPVAGDLDFGWRVARSLAPMIYRSSMDLSGVAGIKQMKERIEHEKGRADSGFDVKIGTGGIRDVEFVAQALQLLHGGRIPQVRGRSTVGVLASLADAGVLSRERTERLLTSYRFLRRVENRLQMEAERQTHRVPSDAIGRTRLARSMGYAGDGGLAAFERQLEAHRGYVQEAFDPLLSEEASDRILALFARGAQRLLGIPSTRDMIQDLARRFAREIERSADPELATNNLDRFIRGIGTRTFYYGLLLDRPELVPRLAALFGASKYLSNLFAAHPDLIEPVFSDPGVLLLTRPQLEKSFVEIQSRLQTNAQRDPAEIDLAALRFFQSRELVNVSLLDLADQITRAEAERALTEIAEICIEKALGFAREQLARQAGTERAAAETLEFLVVGMGKLGSHELSYGSDLDVIFLYDVATEDGAGRLAAQETFIRLAQKLVWVLQTRTAEGFCYAVDTELRPSGNQGLLVTSIDSFESYHAESAQVWERQALLRARPVAG